MAERTGFEPATLGVTGRYSNQLNYRSIVFFKNTKKCWWVMRDLNSRHSPCKGDALPTELITRCSTSEEANIKGSICRLPAQMSFISSKIKNNLPASLAQLIILIYSVLKGFSSFKCRNLRCFDLNGFTGARIASRTCFTVTNKESTETD